MIKLDEVFVPFAREVNLAYEALFPNYPMYPKFSVMRLMVTCWRRDVYDPLKTKMRAQLSGFVKEFHNTLFNFGLEQKNTSKQKKTPLTMVGHLAGGIGKMSAGKSLNLSVPPL